MADYNYRLDLCYDGTRYDGWQKQKNTHLTIEETIEAVISEVLNEQVELHASGRTDAGVHALMQTANFHLPHSIDCGILKNKMRNMLPQDIGVIDLTPADPRFHARLSCKGKSYEYRIWNSEEPCIFERKYVNIIKEPLNRDAMLRASSLFLGTHDFSAFCSMKSKKHSTIRTLSSIEITEDTPILSILYTGDGFLYNMVRILTGTLIEVGLGKRSESDIKHAFETKFRTDAGPTAPSRGLFLKQLYY